MRVLVTGGANGLGRALVEKALAAGASVFVVDVDARGLQQLPSQVTRVVADLGSEVDVAHALACLADEPAFDLVLLNAGISATGRFEEVSLERMERVVAVNLIASMQLAAGLIKAQKLARSGRLVFVSSLSHYVGYPGASSYAATKDGITVFAKSLRRPLWKQNGVCVQIVAPGPMDTAHASEHSPRPNHRVGRIAPQVVAEAIWRSRRRFAIVPGRRAILGALLGRLFPRTAGWLMRRILFEKMLAAPSNTLIPLQVQPQKPHRSP
ncbi:SDR family NAD(P)-dependent oxidoreductase [Mesorhizobium sp. YIM 152430]|uniref:SDR family NAD(P)-dependent oxidoreductase n=1 Tax=Mesorhizobium sp. YIM 152430 TaxID=3031761 RepID=UPI0023D9DE1A|nr:SDR family oxidoreductase [Mesorhizobium sp. YIM 152430]MDF1600245.1 SDR family NAD(P)-dependent oxidoreductase [Mesorhizobium sp. YIM 152430]